MKHKAHGLMFGFAVLFTAALVIMGCDGAAGTDGKDGKDGVDGQNGYPGAVKLAAGSHGENGYEKITGLDTAKYVVYDESTWYGVKADGTLASPATAADNNPKAAAAAAVALSAATVPITGLKNDKTYNVYLVLAFTVTSDTSANTTGQNMIVDISALANAGVLTLSAIAGAPSSTAIVILQGNVVATTTPDSGGTPVHTPAASKIVTDAGSDPNLTFGAVTPGDLKINYTVGEPWVTFTGVGATTTFTLTRG